MKIAASRLPAWLAGAAAAAALAACSPTSGTGFVPEGVWAADGAVFSVRADGARLELDCAHGEVEGALALDRDARFDAPGVFVRERPGPVIEGEPPDSHPARFAGRVAGHGMTLTVDPTDGTEGPGALVLRLGAAGRLTKCL